MLGYLLERLDERFTLVANVKLCLGQQPLNSKPIITNELHYQKELDTREGKKEKSKN